MKHYLLALCLLCGSVSSWAQGFLGYENNNYSGVPGMILNPASSADNRLNFDLTIGANFLAYNNYQYFDTENMPGWWSTLWLDSTEVVARHGVGAWNWRSDTAFYDNNIFLVDNPKNKARSVFQNTTAVFGAMWNIKKNRFGMGVFWNVREYVNVSRVSPELVELATNELDVEELWLTDLEDIFLNISTNTWHEWGVNFASVVFDEQEHFFKVGGNVKLLAGLGAAYIHTNDVNYNLLNDDTAVSITGDFSYGYSENAGELADKFLDESGNWTNYKVDFKKDVLFNFGEKMNLGFGMDIGAVYEYRPNWKDYKYDMDGETDLWMEHKSKYLLKVGLSINDIGGIKYKRGGQSRDFRVDVRDYDLNAFDPVDGFNSFDSVMVSNFPETDEAGKEHFWMNSPTTISLQFDYNIWKPFYINFTGFWGLAPKRNGEKTYNWNNYTITPRVEYDWASMMFPVSYNETSGFRFGMAMQFGPFLVGLPDFMSFIGKGKVRGTDIYAAFKIPVPYTKVKDMDNDAVSDKVDLCLETPGVWEFKGCPDQDMDGIQDSEDDCPTEPGIAEFNGCPDRDGDKVIDKFDNCPDTPGLKEFNGCPDTDGDGVIDKLDSCVNTPGIAKYNGCPDTDKDGIIDRDDLCPEHPGPIENEGCPDTDLDGIFDYLDGCPTEKGPAENQGCPWPDTDNDGILDKDDRCPTIAGPAKNQGCPYIDTDKDGVLDKDDYCPNTPGVKENNGCPMVSKEEEEILNTAFENLEFHSGKAVIKDESFESLNELADLLIKKADWRLKLAGHTDNVGDDRKNMILSKKRAEAVRDYLNSRGVDLGRFVVQWFGETQPTDTNDTPEGRQKNRRVEMEILFE